MTDHNQASRVRKSGVGATTAKHQTSRSAVQISGSTLASRSAKVTKMPNLKLKHV